MAPEVQFEIERMKSCLKAATDRLDPTKPLEDNREALKTMMFGLMTGLSSLTHIVGGESLYVPDAGYLSDDIDNAFSDAIEAKDAAQPNYRAPYSTLDHRTQGISRAGR